MTDHAAAMPSDAEKAKAFRDVEDWWRGFPVMAQDVLSDHHKTIRACLAPSQSETELALAMRNAEVYDRLRQAEAELKAIKDALRPLIESYKKEPSHVFCFEFGKTIVPMLTDADKGKL